MDKSCSCMREMTAVYKILVGKPIGKSPVHKSWPYGRIILKLIMKK